jgi:hypothetical protein
MKPEILILAIALAVLTALLLVVVWLSWPTPLRHPLF